MRRIERIQARRRLAAQATLSVVAVAAVTLGASRVVALRPAGHGSLVEAPPTTKAPEPAKPSPTAKPKPKPKPAAKPSPKPEPTIAPKPVPTYAPKPEPKPEPTKAAPEPAKGLSVELWPYTEAVAGASMDWKVKAYDETGRLLRIEVRFGDGTKSVVEPPTACGEGVYAKQFFPHTYAKAGKYAATAIVTTGGCGAVTETKTAYSSVQVAADSAGNGPAEPTVTAAEVAGDPVTVALHGADADGWVKKFWVSWGDGTESVAGPRPFDGCQDGAASSWDTSATHTYAQSGTYTVTVTVMSTNCTAGDGQTKSVTLTVTV